VRAIDRAHPTSAEDFGDCVCFQPRAWCETVCFRIAGEGCKRTPTKCWRHGLFQESASVSIGRQQRLDIGLQRAVVAAALANQCVAVVAVKNDRSVEYRSDVLPPFGVAHGEFRTGLEVMRRYSHAFALLTSRATVDRDTEIAVAASVSDRPPK
jgi:hypothetical protein